MLDELYFDVEEKMEGTIEHHQRALAGVRTGRASTGLLDGIAVDYYGTETPINQVASVNTPDAQTIAIQPWEETMLAPIEKAIMASDLGLNPNNDGKIIRITMPPLTAERRVELSKHVRKFAEESKIALRNIRREGIEKAKKMAKSKDISEDDSHGAAERIQKILDEKSNLVDKLTAGKEKEIMDR